jgi:hypothetical protein
MGEVLMALAATLTVDPHRGLIESASDTTEKGKVVAYSGNQKGNAAPT